ncbi:ABC transporter substrate-binding protein [Dictyobacter aurantiacus]|uniref:Sugar-binding protein n=1 Tax=Dictyobacter aurantiacus TaxID=1936993 RepID=A0A401ZRH9_9CHLR|nr:extracellular solute-binding protein [Dictyobacter aurantiacus]GCE09404.1 sugar-binding protein [Dictyobacter aurantiacus]
MTLDQPKVTSLFSGQMNRRTFLGGVLGTAATASLLAACGGAPAKSAGPVTVHFWGGVPADKGPNDLVAAFNKLHPDIKVIYTRYVNDAPGNVKLDTALSANGLVDVFVDYVPAYMFKRIDAGASQDLSSYIAQDKEVKQWVDSTQGIVKVKGTYFGLPTATDTGGYFLNKTLLEKTGIKMPQQWTVDEFHAIAKEVSGKNVYGTFDTPDLAFAKYGANANYKDAHTSNFDDPIFRQSLELHRNMIVEKSAFPWTEVMAQNLRVYSQSTYLKGQVLMGYAQGTWIRYIADTTNYPHDFVTAFAPIPTPTGVDQPYSPGGLGSWIHLNTRSQNKEAAWTFLRYHLTDGAKYMIPSGRIPAFPGTDVNTSINGILGPKKDQVFDVESYKRLHFDTPAKYSVPTISTASAEITKILQDQTDRYLIGEINIDTWVSNVKQQSDTAIRNAGN